MAVAGARAGLGIATVTILAVALGGLLAMRSIRPRLRPAAPRADVRVAEPTTT
jgi:hypothetical protein